MHSTEPHIRMLVYQQVLQSELAQLLDLIRSQQMSRPPEITDEALRDWQSYIASLEAACDRCHALALHTERLMAKRP